MTELRTLAVERDGPIVRVWLNRPERRNALDTTALEEIAALFASFARDFAARVVVLGGRGASFCAGATLPAGHVATGGDCDPEDRYAWRWWSYTHRDADGDGRDFQADRYIGIGRSAIEDRRHAKRARHFDRCAHQ